MVVALLLAGGMSLLLGGGHYLVTHAVKLATALKVPPLVIGLTIVAFGTSAPELVISLDAVLTGHDDIVIGNIIGSNIANLLLVLAVSALIFPIRVERPVIGREGAILVMASLLFGLLAGNGRVSFIDGVLLLVCLGAYSAFAFLVPSHGIAGPASGRPSGEPLRITDYRGPLPDLVMIALALCALALGSHPFVDGAVRLSLFLGISEAVIGLTVVAIGTAAPEIITAAVAAWHRHSDVAIGNIIGSSIFNLLGITGITAMASPITVAPRFLGMDFGLMLAASVGVIALGLVFGRLGRTAGAVMGLAYAGYVIQLG